jgi:hypothetical protein
MSQKPTIAVVGASGSQYKQCCTSLTDYSLKTVSCRNGVVDMSAIPRFTELILLFPGKNQAETLQICKQLRQVPETVHVPLLLVVHRYDITHAFVVRSTEKAGIILEPFTSADLRDSVELLAAEATID